MPLAIYRCPACDEECLAEDQSEAIGVLRQTACRGTPVWARDWETEESNTRPAPPCWEVGPAGPVTVRG
jgi:hypothetical protein